MRIEKFKIAEHYTANYGNGYRHNTIQYPVPVSHMPTIVTQLKQAIQDSDTDTFKSLLTTEFIGPLLGSHNEEIYSSMENGRDQSNAYTCTGHQVAPTLGILNEFSSLFTPEFTSPFFATHEEEIPPNRVSNRGQKNVYTYARHQVEPTLEALIVRFPDNFIDLYTQTGSSPECRKILSDFSGLDLTGADLTTIDDFSAVKFNGTTLRQTKGITPSALEQCESYDFAELPDGISQLWAADKAQRVLADLAKLKKYGRDLQLSKDKNTVSKGTLLVNHAHHLIQIVLDTPKHDDAFQKKFLETLHEHDGAFDEPRFWGLKKILGNIAFGIVGGGVLYAAAVGIHYLTTGRCLFFSRTASRELVDQVEENLLQKQGVP